MQDSQYTYLIVGGSTKCGTTSLFNYFMDHPEICASKFKESRFFWQNDYPLVASRRSQLKVNNYEDLFYGCNSTNIRMEATPDYLYSRKSADAIKKHEHNVKFIFILRDPVDRMRSWYKYAIINGLINEGLSFEDYVYYQKLNSKANDPQHMRALQQGNYSKYLKYYFKRFNREDILVLFYEDLIRDPAKLCQQICRFVGIDINYFNKYEFKVFNKSVAIKSVRFHRYFRDIRRGAKPVINLLPFSVRKKIRLAGRSLEETYYYFNKSKIDFSDSNIPVAEITGLYEYYRGEANIIQDMTGLIPPWPKELSL